MRARAARRAAPTRAGAIWRESGAFAVVKRRGIALADLRRVARRRGTRRLCRDMRALSLSLRHDGGARVRRLPADSPSIRHGSSSMFARESDAVSPRLGRCTILVCAARTSRVTRRARRGLVVIGAHSCASAKQWCVERPRLVCLSVAWRHSNSSSSSGRSISSGSTSSGSGGGGDNSLNPVQLLRGVRGEPRGSRSRLRRELARRSARRCVSAAVATATAAAAAAARAARTR